MPTLVCDSVKYLSVGDEQAFFGWLGRIKSVRRFHGEGARLYLDVPKRLSKSGRRELAALFARYGIDQKQLSQFED